MSAVDLRYVRALSAVVSERGLEPDAIRMQLGDFLETLEASSELREVLEDPSVPEPQKLKVLDGLAKRLGICPVARNFVAVVIHHRRLHQLRDMIADYVTLADETSSVAEARVVSAHRMEQADRDMLEKKIAAITGSRRVQATYTEDAGLIGGAAVTVGSTVYDGSVRAQLQQLKARLMEAGS